MLDGDDKLIDKLEKMEKNIANLGSKNLSQDAKMGQINRSVYETKEKVDILTTEVQSVKEGVKVLKEDLAECDARIEGSIQKGFHQINNGSFYPESIKLIIQQNKETNEQLQRLRDVNLEREKIEIELKKRELKIKEAQEETLQAKEETKQAAKNAEKLVEEAKQKTARSKFGFWKAIIVAGISVLGVKIIEWIQSMLG